MPQAGTERMQSNAVPEFAKAVRLDNLAGLNLKKEDVKNGVGRLTLTLLNLLHQLLERQAVRHMEAGSLTEDEIENVGLTLFKQSQEITRLRRKFGLSEADLNIDLGPLEKLW